MRVLTLPKDYKYVGIFLTMRCNLNCGFCLNSLDKSRSFNRSKFKEIPGEEWVSSLNRIQGKSDVPLTFSGGEPMLHPDFVYIIKNLNPDLKIDILTNASYAPSLEKMLKEVEPQRLKRDSPYPSIRVSYHPEQMNPLNLIENVKKIQEGGFSVGIYSVLYPHPVQLQAITQMQFLCKEEGIEFRVKDFTGSYKGELYGDYSKYPGAVLSRDTKSCLCKTSELLIGPNGNVYKCHRDLYEEEFPTGNITDPNFQIKQEFRDCSKYGNCHPCDVKVKTNFRQQLGHTSVEIKEIE